MITIKQLHKQWRKTFRDKVFERDKYECRICGSKSNLDAHHITDRHEMPNGGYVLTNGISLCSICHMKAEKFHINQGKDFFENFHPNDLYIKINSSYDKAYKDSKNLMLY